MTRFRLTRSKFNLSWPESLKIVNKNVYFSLHVESLWNFVTVFKSHLIPKGMGHKIHLKQTPRELEIDLKKKLNVLYFLMSKRRVFI